MNAAHRQEINPIAPNTIPQRIVRGTVGFERAECWYCHQLWIDTRVDVQRGETSRELRQARVRELLLARNLAAVPVIPTSLKRETHGQFFARLYGVELDGTAPRDATQMVQEALL